MQGRAVLGKRVTGPCGHEHETVVGAFTVCLTAGCDGLPGDRCHRCGSRDLYPFHAVHLPADTMACRACGSLRWNGYV